MSDLLAHLQLLSHGGFMMYPLLLSGLIALAVMIERFWLLKSRLITPKIEVQSFFALIQKGDLGNAATQAQASRSPVMNVLYSGVKDPSAPLDEVELSMQNEAEMWIPLVERRLEVLDTVITAAPLMGLLGTITGMMASFQVLSEKGVNEPGAITGGVAEALIATATGLVIALITLVAYNYLNQAVKDLLFEMENAASRLIEVRKSALRRNA
jgi:biopolymer transport protein ExbB